MYKNPCMSNLTCGGTDYRPQLHLVVFTNIVMLFTGNTESETTFMKMISAKD